MQEDRSSSTSGSLPNVADYGEVIAGLRDENARLRAELAHLRAYGEEPQPKATWEAEAHRGIVYADGHSRNSSLSAGRLLKQLAGLSKERMKARAASATATHWAICRSRARTQRNSKPISSAGAIAWLRMPCRRSKCAHRLVGSSNKPRRNGDWIPRS